VFGCGFGFCLLSCVRGDTVISMCGSTPQVHHVNRVDGDGRKLIYSGMFNRIYCVLVGFIGHGPAARAACSKSFTIARISG
jgi:hypothetical protein